MQTEPQTSTIPPSACPVCAYVFEQATGVFRRVTPKPGDVAVCLSCATVLLFTDTLRVRLPTPDEEATLRANPATWRQVQQAVRAIQAREDKGTKGQRDKGEKGKRGKGEKGKRGEKGNHGPTASLE